MRKAQHMLCADALNKKFVMGVTVGQVDRHYRYHKENWGYISKALRKSGNTFDHTRCLVIISESEKPLQNDKERRLLSKPIKFYNEMEELFTGSSADDTDDLRELLDLNCYTQPEDMADEDSDTLPTPTRQATIDNSSSSTSQAGKKRPRGKKSPTKKPKNKSRFAQSTNEITAIMKSLRETLRVLFGEHLSSKENKGMRG
uniref:Myb/SANT-like domain-containing protein n=1 Tax=Setaria italica TaxID=4555 RepID=K3YMD7_SETIT